MMKVSIKKLLLKSLLALSIIWKKKVLQIAIEDQSIASNHCEWTSEEQMYSSFFPVQVT
jgi:hypothetical protein